MRILFATDGSPHARTAQALIASAAWPPGSTIRVVTVARAVAGRPGAGDEVAQAEQLVSEAGAALAGREQVVVEQQVLRGRPGSCIVEEARRFRADVIVLGSRGHGTIGSMLLGSVAAEVTDHAPCPVLVARRPTISRVLLAQDGSDRAARAEAVVREWAIFRPTAIIVVSVAMLTLPWRVPPSVTVLPDMPDYFASVREVRGRHGEIAESAARRLRDAGLEATGVLVDGDPAPAILAAASERDADLLVLGTHGRTGLARLLLGSVARNVLLHAPQSVLIVR